MANLKIIWDNVQNALTYNIYYSTAPGVTIGSGTLISGVQDVVYYHRDLLEDTTYYYIVVAVDSLGNLGSPSVEFSCASSVIVELTITPIDVTIASGESQQYSAGVLYSSGIEADVTALATWDTSNHTIATIDVGGLATTFISGSVNITAEYNTIIASTALNIT